MLQYTKTIKGLKVVAKRCLNKISLQNDLCCYVEYSAGENQVEILNAYRYKRCSQAIG
jgi:hypothetical protein